MKRPRLPDRPIWIEGLQSKGHRVARWVRVLAFRPPRQGELYLSGAIPQAYLAPNDLPTAYWIVEALPPPPEHRHEYDISFGSGH